MMKFLLKILTILFLLAFTITIKENEDSYDFSSLSKFLQKEVKKGRYPGFLTLIQKDGKIIYSEVLGYNDVKNKTFLIIHFAAKIFKQIGIPLTKSKSG